MEGAGGFLCGVGGSGEVVSLYQTLPGSGVFCAAVFYRLGKRISGTGVGGRHPFYPGKALLYGKGFPGAYAPGLFHRAGIGCIFCRLSGVYDGAGGTESERLAGAKETGQAEAERQRNAGR